MSKHTTITRLAQEPAAPLRQLEQLAAHLAALFVANLPWLSPLLLSVALAVRVAVWLRGRRMAAGARLLEVGVPPEVDDRAARVLWSALHDLLRPPWRRLLSGQPHLAWEIAAGEQGSAFRVWVPSAIPPGLIERAIASAWPGTSTTLITEPPPEPRPVGVRVTSELTLSGPGWFALSSKVKPDPLVLILGQLAGLTDGERALVQVIARPATGREQHRLRAAARRIRRGQPTALVPRVIQALQVRPPAPPRLDPTVSPDVREVMDKSAGQLYRCLIRVTVTAPTRPRARGRIHAILGGFAPYNGSRVWLRRRHTRNATARLRDRSLTRRGFLLGVPELAALAHLPQAQGIPGLTRAAARRVPPPPALPTAGRPLGITDAGPTRQLALSVPDGRQHLHVLGSTGAGKSTLIAQLVLADAAAGRGAVVVDPKGDLIDAILQRVERVSGPLVVIDPERASRPVGLNVLQLLAELPAGSVDAVVCDPPYGIDFDGRRWDERAIRESAATTSTRRRLTRNEAFQEWTRTWGALCLEVLKPGGHLLAFGSTRTFHRLAAGLEDAGFELRDTLMWLYASGMPKSRRLPRGTGTSLKPAWEPIALARKKPDTTIEQTMREHGTGVLNIDACRIQERWPANTILSHDERCTEHGCAAGCAVAAIDRADRREQVLAPPSRLFFSAKVSRGERDAGCENLPAGELNLFPNAQRGGRAPAAARSPHPTVKPVELMRWLVRLATPPRGVVLDPFCGSGSTGIAARLEGRLFLGIEQEPAYARIARARITHWTKSTGQKDGLGGRPFAGQRKRRH